MDQKFIFIIISLIIGILIGVTLGKTSQGSKPTPQEMIFQISKTASSKSPLFVLSSVETTPPIPRPLIAAFGYDKNGKELCVFLESENEVVSYTFLEEGISKEKAIEKSKQFLKCYSNPIEIKLGYTGENKYYWSIVFYENEKYLQTVIDFETGEILG